MKPSELLETIKRKVKSIWSEMVPLWKRSKIRSWTNLAHFALLAALGVSLYLTWPLFWGNIIVWLPLCGLLEFTCYLATKLHQHTITALPSATDFHDEKRVELEQHLDLWLSRSVFLFGFGLALVFVGAVIDVVDTSTKTVPYVVDTPFGALTSVVDTPNDKHLSYAVDKYDIPDAVLRICAWASLLGGVLAVAVVVKSAHGEALGQISLDFAKRNTVVHQTGHREFNEYLNEVFTGFKPNSLGIQGPTALTLEFACSCLLYGIAEDYRHFLNRPEGNNEELPKSAAMEFIHFLENWHDFLAVRSKGLPSGERATICFVLWSSRHQEESFLVRGDPDTGKPGALSDKALSDAAWKERFDMLAGALDKVVYDLHDVARVEFFTMRHPTDVRALVAKQGDRHRATITIFAALDGKQMLSSPSADDNDDQPYDYVSFMSKEHQAYRDQHSFLESLKDENKPWTLGDKQSQERIWSEFGLKLYLNPRESL